MNELADLLPSNASTFERNLSKSVARLSDVPMMVRKSWSADDCPVELLPWLAWAFSVDEWDDTWSEAAKRKVIKQSAYVHRKKGTLSAIKRAVEPLGQLIEIVESYNDEPMGVPYTFRVAITTSETLTEEVYEKLFRLIQTYKPERSKLSVLSILAEIFGKFFIGTTMISGVFTTVYPYMSRLLESTGGIFTATTEHTIDTVTLFPKEN